MDKLGRLEAVLGEINSQLSGRNVVLQEGRIAIVDATVIEASQTRVRKRDPEAGSHIKVNAKGKMQAKWGASRPQHRRGRVYFRHGHDTK